MPTIKDQLILHENLKLKVYKDTMGIETIGVGRNLRDKGISNLTAMQMLDEDIKECVDDLRSFVWWLNLDDIRKRVLIDMRFNLGPTGLRKFKNTLKAVSEGRYSDAADGMMKSLWAKQVKGRAIRLSRMMRSGTDYATD